MPKKDDEASRQPGRLVWHARTEDCESARARSRLPLVSEHFGGHPVGLVHFLVALGALTLGSAVILGRKGTQWHRWLGRGYVFLMVALNGTALMIYELFGGFGPFHWMALASLAVILVGYLPARSKPVGWMPRHAYFMTGSYVGLVAAAVAEVASRVPNWSFGWSVFISSVLVVVVGVAWMLARIPRILAA
jgi:uncharacterized membrane protein